MTASELLKIISGGETTKVQFKENMTNAIAAAQEMVAFANTSGGLLLIGIADKTGEITGLSFDDLRQLGQLLTNAANEHIKPPIIIQTETVDVDGKKVLAANIPAGNHKPYKDKEGLIFVKNGADKRKVISNEEIARLLEKGGVFISADKSLVAETTLNDLNPNTFNQFFEKRFSQVPDETGLTLPQLLENLYLGRDGQLNLGGLLLFGKNPQIYRPAFCIKAVSFAGNDLAETVYRDSEDIEGDLENQFRGGMAFFRRNLRKIQNGQPFNSIGQWEISEIALEELLQNALIHRDYFKNGPVRIFIFDDRIEIVSPGKLPNHLSVENVKMGNAVARNNILSSFGRYILPFRGLGSGIPRAFKEQPNLQLFNDEDGEQFVATIPRATAN